MNLVELGVVLRPHGLRGALTTDMISGRDSALSQLKSVYLKRQTESTQHDIEEAAWMPRGWKLKLSGIETIEQAEGLRGAKVMAPRAELPEPDADEFYVSDLIGSDVIDAETQQHLGTLSSIEEVGGGAADRWWIKTDQGELVVPAVPEHVVKVDGSAKKIWIKDPVNPDSSND